MIGEANGQRCGFVALVGAPNVGKSTLVNRMVGSKVSIVTPKVQTTRSRVVGIAMVGETQLVLIDTPGVFEPKRRLDRAMVQAAWRGASDADRILVLVDAKRGICRDTRRILDGLADSKRRAAAVINKIDLVPKPELLRLAETLNATGVVDEIFMISALTGDGVNALRDDLAAAAREGPWMYSPDQAGDIPLRVLAAEITREKLFLLLSQELPYATAVATEMWQERKDGSVRIDQTVYVEREGQKAIVLGKGGAMAKKIGSSARAELERLLERRVHLFLHVKVRENWGNDPERYRDLGLEFNV